MSEVDAILGQVIPAIEAAAGVYGAGLVARIESDAVGASASLGERLLARIWRRVTDRDATRRELGRLATASETSEALTTLSAQLRAAITQDPELRRDLAALLGAQAAGHAGNVAFTGEAKISADNSSVAALGIQGGVRIGGPTAPTGL